MRSSKPVFPPPPPHHQEFLAKLAGKQRAAAGQAESSRSKPEKYVTALSGVKRPPAQEAVDGAVAELPKTRPQPKQHSSFYAASNKAPATAVAGVHDDIGKSGASLPACAASLVVTSRAAPADGPLVATPSVPGTIHHAAAAGDDSISVNAAGPVLTSPARTAAGAASGVEAHSALLGADQGAARCPRLAPLAVRGGAPRGDFRLQQQAFEFLDAQGADLAPALRVFGRELSSDGKRRFLVTSPARLWAEEVEPAAPLGQQQGTAGACGLHLYEIIREGAPCHLYFDLEYVPALNPGVCGDSLVDLLLDLVAEELASSCRVRLPLLGSGVGGGGAAATGAGATSQKDGVSALAVGAAAEGGAGAGAQPGTGAGAVETADDGGAGRDVAVAGSETGPPSSPESAPTTQQVAGTEAAATAVAAGGETQEAAAGSGAAAAVAAVVAVVAVGDTAAWASTTATGAAPGAGAASAGEGQVTDMETDMAEVRLHSGPAAVAIGAATPSSSACQPALTALEAMAVVQAGTAAGQDAALSAGTASPVSAPDTAAATAAANLDYPADAVAQPVTAVDPSGTGAAQGGSAAPVAPPHAGRVECPWAWELCSTTEAKWSRHLIVRIPHCAFKDNFHVNAFVRRLFDRIAADPQRFAPFFVRRCADPAAPPTLFIDPAVYTRNRAFRLYLSCKAGKTAVLRATPRHAVASLLRRRGLLATAPVHKAPSAGARGSSSTISSSTAISGGVGSALLPPQVEREIAEEVFFATLVTTVGRVDRTLTMYDDSAASHGGAGLNTFHANANAAAAATDAAGGAAAQGATGDAWSGIPRLPLPGLGRGGRGGGGGGGGGGEWRRGSGEAFHYGASPFPEVERFIESVCKEGGVQGRVRSWQHHADSTGGGTATLLLGVRDNRWCANVGRPHRSNGIYYLVDLRGGTWCQRCHDPDCRDFRSAAMPLPADVWEACRPKDTPSPPPAPPAPPAPPQQVCGPARPLGPEPGLSAPAAPQPQLHPSALQFERVGPPCAPAAAPRAAIAPWDARTAGNGPGHGNAMDEGIGVGGQGAELGAGITPNGVTSGVGYGIGDVDSDAVFDMMCVEAMERLEREQGW